MGRKMDPATRRRVMASIKSKDTKPELAMRLALRSAGLIGYRVHLRGVPGRPDLAYTRWRVAVFVDGVWWHGHPDYFTPGLRGEYWDRKIGGNVARDGRVDAELAELGWTSVRVWDVDVLRNPEAAVQKVRESLRRAGRTV
jgi:DNA mismatch endonuclease (patch repair protein)